ncbi:MAG: GDSL-type esterase/lipase family protein [Planctomycetia bacterium]|nr:GDSL-type esterase/lipase family protein [Planctomycetia bacterium]
MFQRLMVLWVLLAASLPVFAERILVVGDSITGHSMNLPCGYTHEVRKALDEAGVTDVEFVPLGGSGQTVQSWQNVVKASETQNNRLDIPGIFVKEEMDKGADTVLILLGMNDVLRPLVTDGADRWEIWKAEYQKLIDLLRARISFQKLLLGAPTMLTESPFSYKNLEMDEMEQAIREVAKANHAGMVEIRSDFKRFHENARKANNTYRMIADYVHPGADGHACMTWSILNAIGQKKAADAYLAKHCPEFMRDFSTPGMSLYVVSPAPVGTVVVKGFLRGESREKLTVTPPPGLKLDRIETFGDEGFTLTLSGSCDTLSEEIRVQAGNLVRTVKRNAPFCVAYGFAAAPFHDPHSFREASAQTPIDADVLAGKDPLETVVDGKKVDWLVYYPTADLTGGDDPNNVDFCAMNNASGFATAYTLRRIYSPKAQPARVDFCVHSFSTNEPMVLYLNGKKVYENFFVRGGEKRASTDISLREGWNTFVVRASHTQWQWVLSMRVCAPDGTDLPDLRYATHEPTAGSR